VCGGDWTAQTAGANLEGYDIFHAIMCLRMRVCVVHVDTRAMPVGAITISMATVSGNKDFWTEFLDLYRSLPVLWHVKSELYKNRNLKAKGGGGGHETVVRTLNEINPDANREMIAKHAESLIENHFKQFKKY
jgi:hypothetical protein